MARDKSRDHPFAAYLKTVGRGPTLSRPLTRAEAADAMTAIIEGRVEPAQLGALLLVLRYRGETAAELAGFVDAARAAAGAPPHGSSSPVDLDWPSYADRHRQQPWFVAAALLLAENGVRVLMHGIGGYAEGYAPTRPALARFGIEPATSLESAIRDIERRNFAYVGLETMIPALDRLFDLRPMLGVRTVVNSFTRGINPLAAPAQVQAIVHPPYRELHREAALLLGQPRSVVFKGVGGEVQRNPLKVCQAAGAFAGEAADEDWPATLAGATYIWRDESLDPDEPLRLWRGEIERPVPEAAVVATAAVALKTLGRADTVAAAEAMAAAMWRARDKKGFGVRAA